jgi:hypothetical protein
MKSPSRKKGLGETPGEVVSRGAGSREGKGAGEASWVERGKLTLAHVQGIPISPPNTIRVHPIP